MRIEFRDIFRPALNQYIYTLVDGHSSRSPWVKDWDWYGRVARQNPQYAELWSRVASNVKTIRLIHDKFVDYHPLPTTANPISFFSLPLQRVICRRGLQYISDNITLTLCTNTIILCT